MRLARMPQTSVKDKNGTSVKWQQRRHAIVDASATVFAEGVTTPPARRSKNARTSESGDARTSSALKRCSLAASSRATSGDRH
jgi:hypothetical protein